LAGGIRFALKVVEQSTGRRTKARWVIGEPAAPLGRKERKTMTDPIQSLLSDLRAAVPALPLSIVDRDPETGSETPRLALRAQPSGRVDIWVLTDSDTATRLAASIALHMTLGGDDDFDGIVPDAPLLLRSDTARDASGAVIGRRLIVQIGAFDGFDLVA